MTARFQCLLRPCTEEEAFPTPDDLETPLWKLPSQIVASCRIHMNASAVHLGLAEAMFLAAEGNGRVELTSPWKLAKDPSLREKLCKVMYGLAESLRIIAILISPVLPRAAHGIFDQLNWKMEPALAGTEARFSLADAEWGKLPDGHVVGKPTPLFPRIEADAV